jgi:hypothetical protein
MIKYGIFSSDMARLATEVVADWKKLHPEDDLEESGDPRLYHSNFDTERDDEDEERSRE